MSAGLNPGGNGGLGVEASTEASSAMFGVYFSMYEESVCVRVLKGFLLLAALACRLVAPLAYVGPSSAKF